MSLDLSSLKKAIVSLEKTIKICSKIQGEEEAEEDEIETLQAGVIQNFEFTYELCWKFMKRWIEENVTPELIDVVNRRELFRLSAENRLIDDVDEWMYFHKARNTSSHIYDEGIAQKVYQDSVDFLPYAKELLRRLEQHND